MSAWMWVVGCVVTLSLGASFGFFAGGLMCAHDRRQEEKMRAKAIAALIDARGVALLWLRRSAEVAKNANGSPVEPYRHRRIVAEAVYDALRALESIDEEEYEGALAGPEVDWDL